MQEIIEFDYYKRPFQMMFKSVSSSQMPTSESIRKNFWSLIPDDIYDYLKAKELISSYSDSLEIKIKHIISTKSISYWYHLVRRIGIGSLGRDKSEGTLFLIRAIINAAIQKYAYIGQCSHIGMLNDVHIKDVFNGLLLSDEFDNERNLLLKSPNQLVFLDFNYLNLIEYYELEMLAYEIWKCAATNRIIAKGALLCVDQTNDEKFFDLRTEELDKLVNIYDSRNHNFDSTSTGTVFNKINNQNKEYTLLPIYNVSQHDVSAVNLLLSNAGIRFSENYISNYTLSLLSIKNYYFAHLPLSKDFHIKYKVHFEYILQIILVISDLPIIELAAHKEVSYLGQLIKRGYKLFTKDHLYREIKRYWNPSKNHYLTNLPYSVKEIKKALEFLTLKDRDNINIQSTGPVKLILPGLNKESLIFDHSLISTFLMNLFCELPLAEHGFRGATLEDALNVQKSYLPVTPSKSINRTKKQIDYSIARGKLLIIVECKVVAKSFGIFTGDMQALAHRKKSVILKGLSEVDEKARWLANNLRGTNYNIEGFDYILPVVISPFVEFIDSFEKLYWINPNTPRVLTIKEFNDLINQDLKVEELNNLIHLTYPKLIPSLTSVA